jgi:hypothetical protein
VLPPRTVLLRLWTAVPSLAGLVLAPFFDRRSVRGGVLLCEGATWPRRLGFRYRAMTLGHVVLCVDYIDDDTWSHELAHVRQYERLGPLFVVAYGLASLAAILRGGHVYADNRFERAARARSPRRADGDHTGADLAREQGPTTSS